MDRIEIYSATNTEDQSLSFSDFKIGNIKLAPHLGVSDEISSLDVKGSFAKQLLLQDYSDLKSGRVPLYVCICCADLGCGATTVLVEDLGNKIKWSEFGRESNLQDGLFQNDYMKRTGPFYFDKTEYLSAINPYASK